MHFRAVPFLWRALIRINFSPPLSFSVRRSGAHPTPLFSHSAPPTTNLSFNCLAKTDKTGERKEAREWIFFQFNDSTSTRYFSFLINHRPSLSLVLAQAGIYSRARACKSSDSIKKLLIMLSSLWHRERAPAGAHPAGRLIWRQLSLQLYSPRCIYLQPGLQRRTGEFFIRAW